MDKTIPLLLNNALFTHEKKTAGGGMRQQWRKALEQALLETSLPGQAQIAVKGIEQDLQEYAAPADNQDKVVQAEPVLAGFNLDMHKSIALSTASPGMIPVQESNYPGKIVTKQAVLALSEFKSNTLLLGKTANSDPAKSPLENRLRREFYERFSSARNAALLKHTDDWHLVIRDADLMDVDLKSFTLSLLRFFDQRALKITKITINGKSIALPESEFKNTEHQADKNHYLIDKSY